MKYLKYAKDIINGKILSCKLVKLACQRFLNDLDNCKKLRIYFDKKEAERVIKFYNFLPHIKGEFAGKPLLLEPWEQFIIANLFGWKREDTGKRRFRNAFISIGRKNGKSSLIAGIGLYMLFADNEAGAEIYSAATTRDQAKIVFDIAKHMVQRSKLKKYITHFKTNLNIEETASKFEPLSSDYNTLDGLNPHAALIDELHAQKRDLYDVLTTAIGARSQPLIVSITTAGYDRHSICYEQELYTEKILEGIIQDDSHFGIIYTLDNPEEWEDEKNWIKANPNIGISVDIEDLRSKAKKAKEVPTQLNAFLRKNMNIWTESHTRWISTEKWDACGGQIDRENLKGGLCYGGLDLSTTTDISALVLVFPPIEEKEKYKILCRFWIPSDNMHERVRRDKVPYDVWARQGYIKPTLGNIIDYSFILAQIQQDMKDYDFKELAFDRWGSQKIMTDLQNLGFEEENIKYGQRHLIDFGQGFASMNSPTKELEKMILSKEICHGDNPVLKWMMSNVAIKMDAAGNIKCDKAESTDRIDGIVALIMAIDRATRNKNKQSVYEEREILVI